jgi:exosome complex component RRP4
LTALVEKKKLVVPGEQLAENDYSPGENTYKLDGKVYASRVGLVDFSGNRVYVVALKGAYVPLVEDPVIGRITDIGMSGWEVDIGAPYRAMLPSSETFGPRQPFARTDLSKTFDVGDLVLARVISFDRTRDPLLTAKDPGLGKASSGRLMRISPAKIPRLIGRKGSMISMLKRETNCQISVGQNGIVLVQGRSPIDEKLAIEAINMIEREAHTQGLTVRIHDMIEKSKGSGNIEPTKQA